MTAIGNLIRSAVEQSQQTGQALKEHLRVVRGCQSTTKTGQPCKAWAVWEAEQQLCAAHLYQTRGKELTPEEREARARRRRRPRCDCPAYPFPHRLNTGHCCAPEEPHTQHPLQAGARELGKLRRRKLRCIRAKYGI